MSQKSHLLTAVASAAIAGLAVQAFHTWRTSSPKSVVTKKKPFAPVYDEELIQEQLARNYAFLGKEGMEKVRELSVVVVGVGGVGLWVATMLVRSGVKKVRIIDFDQVTLSSLNRHAVANVGDVGELKVDALKRHLHKIAPWVEIEAINELWCLESSERLMTGKIDYVVDCIDNIDTKVDLLEYCYKRQLRVVSLGGAACKSDPTRINVADILITEEDALMKSVRRRLKKRGVRTGIQVAFSAEKPDPRKASLLPLPEGEYAKGQVDELSALQNFRVRILPVLGPMPGMFGLAIVSHILGVVSGYPIEVVEGKNRNKAYDSAMLSLGAQQTRLGLEQQVPISFRDVEYLIEEVFRGKLPLLGYSTRLALSRWRPGPITLQNLVVMTKEEQRRHEQEVLLGGKSVEEVYSKEVLDLVERRFREERYYDQFR